MTIPEQIPGLRWLLLGVGAYAAVWIALEGALWRVLLLALGLTAVLLLAASQHLLGGRTLSAAQWVGTVSGAGALLGAGTAVLGLFLMIVKTGLHNHGPEFSIAEINWLAAQIPRWFLAGALAGMGLGLLLLWAFPRRS